MLSILRTRLPVEERELRAALARYIAALEAHKKTVGQPAPWPEFDILFDIVASGGDFIVVDDEANERAHLTDAERTEIEHREERARIHSQLRENDLHVIRALVERDDVRILRHQMEQAKLRARLNEIGG